MLALVSRRTRPRLEAVRALGERVRDRRMRAGLTQQELAERLGMSVGYISLIERGGRNPALTTVVALAMALGASPRELMG